MENMQKCQEETKERMENMQEEIKNELKERMEKGQQEMPKERAEKYFRKRKSIRVEDLEKEASSLCEERKQLLPSLPVPVSTSPVPVTASTVSVKLSTYDGKRTGKNKVPIDFETSGKEKVGRRAVLLARWIVRSVSLEIVGSSGHEKVPTRENRVWSDQEDHEREDRTIVRQALMDSTVTRSTIRADVGVAIVPQTISRHLAETNLKAVHPFRALPLTPEHRQLRLQWC
ncbi:HTH_Tnp_Tc3_2 domain-containing protein [Trichonephila clavipes]|nr:HTH_Tnp_Tc3_2 domain-containing protein [Trichonephila clavipes]